MAEKLKILFLCGGNACRSQMAEGFLRARGADRVDVFSAGVEAHGIHPRTVEVMREAGVDISAHSSKAVTELGSVTFDAIVTLCEPAREYCTAPSVMTREPDGDDLDPVARAPLFIGDPVHLHWALDDPAAAAGSDDEVMAVFREVRDEIARRIDALLDHGYLAALHAQRHRVEALLDSLEDGIMVHDRGRRIYLANEAIERITGYSKEEILTRDCHEVFHPGGVCGGACAYVGGGDEAPEQRDLEVRFVAKDGTEKRLRLKSVAIDLGSGAGSGALVTLRDITEVSELRWKLKKKHSFHGMVGVSPPMQEAFQTIREVAPSDYSVLITGESGTGKELVANALHNESRRAGGPFVPVNCGALPENILESELFGHVRGAFTGAIRDKKGRFELADRGTLFLDEVGELSMTLQVKLLRVLQEKRFERVGGEKTLHADVRIISATNQDLRELVREGKFREDLYYRLCVVPIHLAPLRERRADMPFLVEHVMKSIRSETGKAIGGVSREVLDSFLAYPWPGNVRELINALQFSSIRCSTDEIQFSNLPPEVRGQGGPPLTARGAGPLQMAPPGRRRKLDVASVRQALVETGGNKVQAAKLLGVGRATLYRFLKEKPLD